jgi:hypothetical protein
MKMTVWSSDMVTKITNLCLCFTVVKPGHSRVISMGMKCMQSRILESSKITTFLNDLGSESWKQVDLVLESEIKFGLLIHLHSDSEKSHCPVAKVHRGAKIQSYLESEW